MSTDRGIIPNLFIVGAPKCGTTALHTYLGQHPEIFMAREKENNHFATDLIPENDPFRSDETYLEMFRAAGDRKIVGESSVYYLLSKDAAANIYRSNPRAKIIIMLRRPEEMLQSFHAQLVYNGDEDIIHFEAALKAEKKRKSGRLKIKAGLRFKERLFYGEVVSYASQVRRYLDLFKKEQVRIIIFDDFKMNPAEVYRQTLEFLGVDATFQPEFPVINEYKKIPQKPRPASSIYLAIRRIFGLPPANSVRESVRSPALKPPLDPKTRKKLKEYFKPDIQELSLIIGRDLSFWWQDKRNSNPLIYSTWAKARERLVPEVWPECRPSFKISRNDKIFTIGSCFVRNIEEYLTKRGYRLPMMSFAVPKNEWPNRPNGILNKYSPAAIYQELCWCEKIYLVGGSVTLKQVESYLYTVADGQVIDLHLGGYVPVTKERALARRQEIYDVFSQIFSSELVVMTLGLVETWRDLDNGLFIQQVPTALMNHDRRRFQFIRLNYQECFDYVQKAISLIRRYRPDCKFLITTSPVPLKETFTGEDVIIANTYSKAVLRAVCGEIVDKNELVDYFPSFENVTLTRNSRVFEKDGRHVADKYVKKIVEKLIQYYF